MPPVRRSRQAWPAIALVATAALVFTNAGWCYRWQVRAADHVEQINALVSAAPQEPRIVYEYRGAANATRAAVPRPVREAETSLGEECRGGVIVRRTADGLESSGERCQ